MRRVKNALRILRFIVEAAIGALLLAVSMMLLLFGMYLQQFDAVLIGALLAVASVGAIYGTYRHAG